MRILALETDTEKIKQRFCHEGEEIVLFTYYHGLSFFFAILREICITVTLLVLLVVSFIFSWPLVWVIPVLLALWLIFVFFNVVKAYIDWAYDFIIVTTDKVILVDQTSVIKQEVMPLHIENIGGISTTSQYWDIFPFGEVCIHLKEGKGGEDVTLKHVPRYKEVAGVISDVVTQYQRRQYHPDEGSPTPLQGQGAKHHVLDPVRNPIQPEHPDSASPQPQPTEQQQAPPSQPSQPVPSETPSPSSPQQPPSSEPPPQQPQQSSPPPPQPGPPPPPMPPPQG